MLADGTLLTVTAPGDVWLGSGNGAARSWSRVTIDPVWSWRGECVRRLPGLHCAGKVERHTLN